MSNKNYSKERFCCGISIQVDRWPATCINFWAADIDKFKFHNFTKSFEFREQIFSASQ